MKDFKFLLKHNFIVNLGPFFFFLFAWRTIQSRFSKLFSSVRSPKNVHFHSLTIFENWALQLLFSLSVQKKSHQSLPHLFLEVAVSLLEGAFSSFHKNPSRVPL